MNFIKRVNKAKLLQLARRFKTERIYQPGLTRFEWDGQKYEQEPFERSRITHGTNAEELIAKIPVVEVDDDVALCYGVNDLGWGHPIEFVILNSRNPQVPKVCKYCGLRFAKKSHSHH